MGKCLRPSLFWTFIHLVLERRPFTNFFERCLLSPLLSNKINSIVLSKERAELSLKPKE
jgi:hypothetical protein